MFNQVDDDFGQVGFDEGVAGVDDQLGQSIAKSADGFDGGIEGGLAGDDVVDRLDEGNAQVTAESLGQSVAIVLVGGNLLLKEK
jgi:hypothetical protein